MTFYVKAMATRIELQFIGVCLQLKEAEALLNEAVGDTCSFNLVSDWWKEECNHSINIPTDAAYEFLKTVMVPRLLNHKQQLLAEYPKLAQLDV